MKHQFISRIRKDSVSWVLPVPPKLCEFHDVQVGDLLSVQLIDIKRPDKELELAKKYREEQKQEQENKETPKQVLSSDHKEQPEPDKKDLQEQNTASADEVRPDDTDSQPSA